MRAFIAASLLTLIAGGTMAAEKVQIGTSNVFPESITSTADGTLIVGSIGTGQIYKASAGETTAAAWINAPIEGPSAVLGVYADNANRMLWACYSDMALFSADGGKGSVLRSYDLATGSSRATIPLGDGTFCNDIATTADGTAYIADTAGGQLFRVLPGSSAAELLFKDPALASLDGVSLGPDGALYLNGVSTNKLFRLTLNEDGTAGGLSELTLSQPITGPDGMRFGDDGVLYLAENGSAQVDAVTFEGDHATIKVLQSGEWDMPTAVTKVGDTLWVLEAKLSKMGSDDAGMFFAHPLALH